MTKGNMCQIVRTKKKLTRGVSEVLVSVCVLLDDTLIQIKSKS